MSPDNDCYGDFFVMHTGRGVMLINAEKRKTYVLAQNEQVNFNVCKSIAVQPKDAENPDEGFWLAQIDNGNGVQQMIKAFVFDTDFMEGLK